MKLPFPENPEHVDNLASLSLLESQGFDGMDASLSECLFEYGFVWRTLPDGSFLFVYSHPSLPGRFDRCSMKQQEPFIEWNWIQEDSKAGFLSYLGTTEAEWIALSFPWQVFDLLSYFGPEEIFGTSYWEGFIISRD